MIGRIIMISRIMMISRIVIISRITMISRIVMISKIILISKIVMISRITIISRIILISRLTMISRIIVIYRIIMVVLGFCQVGNRWLLTIIVLNCLCCSRLYQIEMSAAGSRRCGDLILPRAALALQTARRRAPLLSPLSHSPTKFILTVNSAKWFGPDLKRLSIISYLRIA